MIAFKLYKFRRNQRWLARFLGIVGYLVGFFFSMQFRFWGHMVRTSASIDERLASSRGG